MRQIECDLAVCGQVTYLIDETYTLDRGWAQGTDTSTAPFYVCPSHVGRYTLTPMPAASISPAKSEPDATAADPGPEDRGWRNEATGLISGPIPGVGGS
jgi:hypothetical protein